MKKSKINNNHKIQTLRRSNRNTKKTQENDVTNDSKLQNKGKKRKILETKNDNNEITSKDNNNLSQEKSRSTLFSETPIQVNDCINEDHQAAESSIQNTIAIREKKEKFVLNTELLSDEDDEEEPSEKNNYFQFLENQKLNEESNFYGSNYSDQESEEQIDYTAFRKSLLNQETHSAYLQGNNNKEGTVYTEFYINKKEKLSLYFIKKKF